MAKGVILARVRTADGHVTITRSERKLAEIIPEAGCYA